MSSAVRNVFSPLGRAWVGQGNELLLWMGVLLSGPCSSHCGNACWGVAKWEARCLGREGGEGLVWGW